MRLPDKLPQLPQVPKDRQVQTMPNAKPSFRSNMPVHKHDESKVIPMPNSAADSETFQLKIEELLPKDSSQRKKKP
ncbi:hypothetical protein ACO2Q8_01300 [Larkinella sp. VNQ87]|uniref:hypothetical protein n=1 Tax=Larkinella sp. VNQ87 TaxID=3400921 RepID=UPI003BFA7CBD